MIVLYVSHKAGGILTNMNLSKACKMNENAKVKNFYTLMCLAGLLIVLLPVGIANVVFG